MARVPAATKSDKSAAPGSKDDAGKKEPKQKIVKVSYLAEDADKLTEVPKDFDPKKHKPLKRTDFKCESTFCLMKADEFDAKAKAMRNEAELIKNGGGTKAAKKAQRLIKMKERLAELEAQLEKEGVDVDALMASMTGEDS